MALYDNKYWLLSHIRNSFLATDDTGMCELIMAGEEDIRKHLKQSLDSFNNEDSEEEDDLSHESYDLQLDTDYGVRYRTSTAVRLEKLEQEKKRAGRMKHIKWEVSKTPLSQEQIDELFVKKEIDPSEVAKKSSLLTKTLKQYNKLPSNPYINYAKFDGSGQVSGLVKNYKIFLTMLPEHQRNYPLHVCCIVTARIQDLIGLILLKCSTTYDGYSWKSVSNYGLYITEEDGEVDRDFPCLDFRESITKFGFNCLGLVEHTDSAKAVTFDHSDSLTISGRTNRDTMDRKLKEQSKIEEEKQTSTDLHLMDTHNKAMEAPLYKSYTVNMLNKMKVKIEVHLGVSGDKIEIDPVQQNTKFALIKKKPINHHIDSLASCEIVDTKSHKTTFKIICNPTFGNSRLGDSGGNFKTYEFEADHSVAEEIIQKINLILQLRSSETRRQYLAIQHKKDKKKHN